jgi:hypothetical protein
MDDTSPKLAGSSAPVPREIVIFQMLLLLPATLFALFLSPIFLMMLVGRVAHPIPPEALGGTAEAADVIPVAVLACSAGLAALWIGLAYRSSNSRLRPIRWLLLAGIVSGFAGVVVLWTIPNLSFGPFLGFVVVIPTLIGVFNLPALLRAFRDR